MRIVMSVFFSIFFLLSTYSQDHFGEVLFWSAQQWECEFLKIDLYTADSTIVFSGKLDRVYKGFDLPICGHEQTLTATNMDTGSYFFVADCSTEQCGLCAGEGSYWQPIVHNKTARTSGTGNKGNIEGTYKTCYLCDGVGQASTILWIDTLKVYENKCRSVLLK